MTLSVRVTGALSDFVSSAVGKEGPYENTSEYVRDLIRRDKERHEQEDFERLKAELQVAFATPDDQYKQVSAAEIRRRHRVPV
ncbi:MAG TPA: addiction module antitoxin [Sphingomicrobium sp.]|nr:addiction module antitoxin [Sphingomicrobium sp.]